MFDWNALAKVFFSWKYLFFLLFCLAGWILLARNRPMRPARLITQLLAFLLFGGVLGLIFHGLQAPFGLHPSPMCATTKGIAIPIIYHKIAMPQFALVLAALLMAIVGAKAFCGWVCPVGAIQELIGRIPGLKRFRVPFSVSNTIRALFFALFIILVVAIKRISYDYFNPFEFLHWHELGKLSIWGPMTLVLLASLFIYRPFCSFICPLGLLTWVTEFVAPGRIRVSHACNNCGVCVEKTDCQAMPAIVAGKSVLPDCFGCGDCLDTCPENAISFGWRKKD